VPSPTPAPTPTPAPNPVPPGNQTPVAPAPTCTFTVAPERLTVPHVVTRTSLAVSASSSSCAWRADAQEEWLHLKGRDRGTGNGDVEVVIDENTERTTRSGTIAIAGQTVPVSQAAGPGCSYQVRPTAVSMQARGGRVDLDVETTGSCRWMATTTASWIRVQRGAEGAGKGRVEVDVDTYDGNAARTGVVVVAGRDVTIAQDPARGVDAAMAGDIEDVAGKCPDLTLRLDGQTIRTDRATAFTGEKCDTIKPGHRATVRGQRLANGFVLAAEVDARKR
jgi:hypothetical protein